MRLILMFAFVMSMTAGITLPIGAIAAEVPGAAKALNDFRATKGRKALRHSDGLQKVAEGHANDMSRKGFFSHSGSDGSDIGDRARRAGYRYCFIAENIAKGQRDLNEVMNSWITSPGHNKNMAHKKAREFGLARTKGDVWVMVLGRDGC